MSLPVAADEKIESSHQLTEINCCMLSAAFRVFQVDNLQLLANHQWLSKSFVFLKAMQPRLVRGTWLGRLHAS
jgi:hypothetical protein